MTVLSLACTLISNVPGADPTMAPPANTPTPAFSSTPPVSSEATVTPAPASLNPDGPYVLFEGDGGIWISNPDGTFPRRISDQGFVTPFQDPHRAVSPDGSRLAQILSNESGADLVILRLPSGETEFTAHLADRPGMEDQTSPMGLAWHAITRYDNVAWEPGDGRRLAFIGAMDGPTADLYLYDTVSKKITRLTDGASQALFPTWSPDGAYILHFGGSWVEPIGGALVEYNRADGAWGVHLEDGSVITQPGKDYRHTNFLGWVDSGHYLLSHVGEDCQTRDIDSVAIADGTKETLFEGCYDFYQAFSPQDGTVLLSSTECDGCPLGQGTFLWVPGGGEPVRIWDEKAWGIDWLPESRVFEVYPLGAVSGDGLQRHDPPAPEPSGVAVSARGWVAWLERVGQSRQVVIERPGAEPTILSVSLGAMIWDPLEGKTLLGVSGGTVYAASPPDFSPRVAGELGGRADRAIWLP